MSIDDLSNKSTEIIEIIIFPNINLLKCLMINIKNTSKIIVKSGISIILSTILHNKTNNRILLY
jgi:hypothetical protein